MPLERRRPDEAKARSNPLDRLTSGRYPARESGESEVRSQNTGPSPDSKSGWTAPRNVERSEPLTSGKNCW
jgi:hypothetical protein